ncbi:MAG: hypothetical protein PHC34_13375 [Candidatus Gastranaerophilales bacterium]|nr:hypothetical protein [Candidatus Gastranaerophilales bacterium]
MNISSIGQTFTQPQIKKSEKSQFTPRMSNRLTKDTISFGNGTSALREELLKLAKQSPEEVQKLLKEAGETANKTAEEIRQKFIKEKVEIIRTNFKELAKKEPDEAESLIRNLDADIPKREPSFPSTSETEFYGSSSRDSAW